MKIGQLPQGLRGHGQGTQKRNKRPDIHLAADRAPTGIGHDSGRDQGHQGLGRGRGGSAGIGPLDQVRLTPLDHSGHAGLFIGLAVLDLDDLDPVQAFHDGGRQGRGLGHGPLGGLGGAFGKPAHDRYG